MQWHTICELLSKTTRRFISFIHSAVRLGFHKDLAQIAINRGLKEPLPPHEFEHAWKLTEYHTHMWERIKYVRRDRAITERLMAPFRYPFDGKYAYVVDIKARNVWTGEEVEKTVTLKSWERLKRGEVEQAGEWAFYKYPEFKLEDWEIEKVRITEAWYNPYF